MMKTLIAVQKYRCPWNTHSRCQHWSSEPDSVPLHVMGDDLHIDGFGLQNKDDLCSVYWKAWRLWKKAFFCRAKCFTDLCEAACISSSCYFYPLTFNFPPLSSSLIFSRASTVLFRSLCSRLPKSLNMVEPPESTTFCDTTQNNYCYVLRVHVSNRSRQVRVYLVERTPDVDGTVLDDFIHHFWDGLGEVWVGKLDENKKVKLKKI